MSRRTRIGAVAGGYALALVAARVAAWLYDLRVSALRYDTSGGMYAFGQLSAALSAFLVVALPATALAVWFMRRGGMWKALATASFAFLGASVLAALASW
jgi:hypothetical protein